MVLDRAATPEFPHYAKASWHSSAGRSLFVDLARFFPQPEGGTLYVLGTETASYEGAFIPVPLSGPATFAGVDVVVENREKQGFAYLWFRTRDDLCALVSRLCAKRAAERVEVAAKIKRPLMRMTCQGRWTDDGEYPARTPETFVGYGAYLERILSDVRRLEEHRALLERMGESVSLNYLLHGPPGTGKTTLALTVATVLGLTVHIASSTTRKNALLSPPGSKLRALLFEDFDRCLTVDETDGAYMSDVLNTLDGVNSGSGVIRFFTGNDCGKIFANQALMSRMTAAFRFEWPTREMFQTKLDNVFAAAQLPPPGPMGFDPHAECSMRQFSAFAIRHVFGDHGGDPRAVLDAMRTFSSEVVPLRAPPPPKA
jgi:hypothetical protein